MGSVLYVSDVDFTLLHSRKSLSSFSRKALDLIQTQNIDFTIATARSLFSLQPLLGDVTFKLPVIEFNGGYVSNYQDKTPYFIHDLPISIVRGIREFGLSSGIYPLVSGYSGRQLVFPPDKSNPVFEHYFKERKEMNDPRIQKFTSFDKVIQSKVMAMTYMGDKNSIGNLHNDLLSSQYCDKIKMHFYENKYTPGTFWLTIHDITSTKEYAIQRLCQKFDLEQHELVVFGDDVNDLGMMELADQAIAVSNAKDEVKRVADQVIGSNDDDAVMRYILERESV